MTRPVLFGLGGLALAGAIAIGAMATAEPAAAGPVVTVYKTPT